MKAVLQRSGSMLVMFGCPHTFDHIVDVLKSEWWFGQADTSVDISSLRIYWFWRIYQWINVTIQKFVDQTVVLSLFFNCKMSCPEQFWVTIAKKGRLRNNAVDWHIIFRFFLNSQISISVSYSTILYWLGYSTYWLEAWKQPHISGHRLHANISPVMADKRSLQGWFPAHHNHCTHFSPSAWLSLQQQLYFQW